MKYYGILFTRKSGKVVKILENDFGDGLLKMFAMNNVSQSRDFIVFNSCGIVSAYFEGKKNDFPNICADMVGKHVEEFGFSMKDLI